MTVFKNDGTNVWDKQAAQLPAGSVAWQGALGADGGARIIACSDRWIHVSNFPLDITKETDIPAAGQTLGEVSSYASGGFGKEIYPCWLFRISDGLAVPARLDTKQEVRPLGGYWGWHDRGFYGLRSASWVEFPEAQWHWWDSNFFGGWHDRGQIPLARDHTCQSCL